MNEQELLLKAAQAFEAGDQAAGLDFLSAANELSKLNTQIPVDSIASSVDIPSADVNPVNTSEPTLADLTQRTTQINQVYTKTLSYQLSERRTGRPYPISLCRCVYMT